MKFQTSLFATCFLFLAGEVPAQNCSADVTPMIFGGVDAISGAAVDSLADLSIDCDAQTAYLVRIDGGQNSVGGFSARRMRHFDDASFMEYNLFLDSSRALIWGDGTGGSHVASGVNPGVRQSIAVYGKILGGQNLSAGQYSDSVTVIIEW